MKFLEIIMKQGSERAWKWPNLSPWWGRQCVFDLEIEGDLLAGGEEWESL